MRWDAGCNVNRYEQRPQQREGALATGDMALTSRDADVLVHVERDDILEGKLAGLVKGDLAGKRNKTARSVSDEATREPRPARTLCSWRTKRAAHHRRRTDQVFVSENRRRASGLTHTRKTTKREEPSALYRGPSPLAAVVGLPPPLLLLACCLTSPSTNGRSGVGLKAMMRALMYDAIHLATS